MERLERQRWSRATRTKDGYAVAGEEQEGWVGLADEALISPLCAGEAFEMRCGLARRYDETGVLECQ
jgi:hypothetical protein